MCIEVVKESKMEDLKNIALKASGKDIDEIIDICVHRRFDIYQESFPAPGVTSVWISTDCSPCDSNDAVEVSATSFISMYGSGKIDSEADETFEATGEFEAKVRFICDDIADILIDKNKKYGNSALEPKRIFSSSDTIEQLNVRIDDKLTRTANQNERDDEDAELDLIGYLILKRIVSEK